MIRTYLSFTLTISRGLFTLWVGLALLIFLALAGPVMGSEAPAETVSQEAMAKSIEEQWGIQVLGIQRTAANYMLDFRYRVVDAEKAEPIFQRKTRPYVLDQESGTKLIVFSSPKTGPLRSTDTPKIDRNYFTIFANPGRFIQAGNKVTVVIGDFKVENLIVQ